MNPSQAACVSLLTPIFNGTYATIAPYVNVCRDIQASDPTDYGYAGFQGFCVSFFSITGYEYAINQLSGYFL